MNVSSWGVQNCRFNAQISSIFCSLRGMLSWIFEGLLSHPNGLSINTHSSVVKSIKRRQHDGWQRVAQKVLLPFSWLWVLGAKRSPRKFVLSFRSCCNLSGGVQEVVPVIARYTFYSGRTNVFGILESNLISLLKCWGNFLCETYGEQHQLSRNIKINLFIVQSVQLNVFQCHTHLILYYLNRRST